MLCGLVGIIAVAGMAPQLVNELLESQLLMRTMRVGGSFQSTLAQHLSLRLSVCE